MNRRDFITLVIGGAVIAPSAAPAQQRSASIPRERVFAQVQSVSRKIGYLHPRTAARDSPTVAVLRTAWEKLGYSEPGSVVLLSAEGERGKAAGACGRTRPPRGRRPHRSRASRGGSRQSVGLRSGRGDRPGDRSG